MSLLVSNEKLSTEKLIEKHEEHIRVLREEGKGSWIFFEDKFGCIVTPEVLSLHFRHNTIYLKTYTKFDRNFEIENVCTMSRRNYLLYRTNQLYHHNTYFNRGDEFHLDYKLEMT